MKAFPRYTRTKHGLRLAMKYIKDNCFKGVASVTVFECAGDICLAPTNGLNYRRLLRDGAPIIGAYDRQVTHQRLIEDLG